ncbi:hypothetical protein KC19_VG011700 [Ceratodon purpureus]|uniref:Uncharacterized protein n=1 Tax=Ceratodon purpureus TaxID=3225 RepID=A0A8T0HKV5_CERPU|nr:hypothetical protein KC19_VG011700 [Ceratodon purpureus]
MGSSRWFEEKEHRLRRASTSEPEDMKVELTVGRRMAQTTPTASRHCVDRDLPRCTSLAFFLSLLRHPLFQSRPRINRSFTLIRRMRIFSQLWSTWTSMSSQNCKKILISPTKPSISPPALWSNLQWSLHRV